MAAVNKLWQYTTFVDVVMENNDDERHIVFGSIGVFE